MSFTKKLMSSMILAGLTVSLGAFAATTTKNDNALSATPTVVTSTTPVNINKADLASLESIKGLGATKAQAIIDYRAKNGSFKNVSELENVPGIGSKLLEKIQSQVMV